jgi:hypothetical protein
MIPYLTERQEQSRFLLEEVDDLELGNTWAVFCVLLPARPCLHESCGFPKVFATEAGLKDAFWRGVVITE